MVSPSQVYNELYALITISTVLYYPIGFYCIWVILKRALRLKCRRLVIMILGLISAGTLIYPWSRFIFIFAYHSNNEGLYWLAAIVGCASGALIWLALWTFAIKLWAIAQSLKEIRERPFYDRGVIVILNWVGISALVIATILLTAAEGYYKNEALLAGASAFIVVVQISIICVFYDAYRQIRSVGGEQEISILLDLKQLQMFVIAFSIILIPQILMLLVALVAFNSKSTPMTVCWCLCFVTLSIALWLIIIHLMDFMEKVYEREAQYVESQSLYSSQDN